MSEQCSEHLTLKKQRDYGSSLTEGDRIWQDLLLSEHIPTLVAHRPAAVYYCPQHDLLQRAKDIRHHCIMFENMHEFSAVFAD